MSNEIDAVPSKGQLKYYNKTDKKCSHCEELSQKIDNVERQNNTIIEILAEHKILMSRIITQNKVIDNITDIFPLQSEIKLHEFDVILQTQSDPYIRHMKSLLKGNVGRYLYEILGTKIIDSFNVDGTHGKKGLKAFQNVYAALIDAISSFDDQPDSKLRSAFQRQKKKIFKSNRLEKLKSKDNEGSNSSIKLK